MKKKWHSGKHIHSVVALYHTVSLFSTALLLICLSGLFVHNICLYIQPKEVIIYLVVHFTDMDPVSAVDLD